MENINVYLQDIDSQSIAVQVDENTTAQEVLRGITSKNQIIKDTELHEYALFIKLENAENSPLKERMLSSHECPLKIKVSCNQKRALLDTRFKFVAKKCSSSPVPMEDNVLADKNPSEEMIREGVLKKYSNNKWSDRYFILDAKCIFYGKDKKNISKAFTRIDLETVSIQDAPENGKYCFQLTIAQHNKYILKGNNTQNKEKWMQSISNQCSIVRENREFDTINQNIRKEEKKRSSNDEKLVTDCHDFEKLIQIEEGIKLLINLEPREDVHNCLLSIIDYRNLVKIKPSQALGRAESIAYIGILNSIEELHIDASIQDIFNPELISSKNKRLSDIKKLKSNAVKSDIEFDLYAELFEEFVNVFINVKRTARAFNLEYNEEIMEKLYELPLNKWKSKLRSVPEPILIQK